MMTDAKWTKDDIAPLYDIRKDGTVISLAHNWRGYGQRPMRHTLNSDGYPSVRLTINGRRIRLAVHRLVALFHLEPRPSLRHELRHLDGNKRHCSSSNLKWGTALENAADRDAHGRSCRGEKHPRARLKAPEVVKIRRRHSHGESVTALSAVYGVSGSQIRHIIKRENWKHV